MAAEYVAWRREEGVRTIGTSLLICQEDDSDSRPSAGSDGGSRRARCIIITIIIIDIFKVA